MIAATALFATAALAGDVLYARGETFSSSNGKCDGEHSTVQAYQMDCCYYTGQDDNSVVFNLNDTGLFVTVHEDLCCKDEGKTSQIKNGNCMTTDAGDLTISVTTGKIVTRGWFENGGCGANSANKNAVMTSFVPGTCGVQTFQEGTDDSYVKVKVESLGMLTVTVWTEEFCQGHLVEYYFAEENGCMNRTLKALPLGSETWFGNACPSNLQCEAQKLAKTQ